MSLNITINGETFNITHNLSTMALYCRVTPPSQTLMDAGVKKYRNVYDLLWRGDEFGMDRAWKLVEGLCSARYKLSVNTDKHKVYEKYGNWGTLEQLVIFVEKLLIAAICHPRRLVRYDR